MAAVLLLLPQPFWDDKERSALALHSLWLTIFLSHSLPIAFLVSSGEGRQGHHGQTSRARAATATTGATPSSPLCSSTASLDLPVANPAAVGNSFMNLGIIYEEL